jgi:hypothetical protein
MRTVGDFKQSRNYAILKGILNSLPVRCLFVGCVVLPLLAAAGYAIHIMYSVYYKFLEYLVMNEYLPKTNESYDPMKIWVIMFPIFTFIVFAYILIFIMLIHESYKQIKKSIQEQLNKYDTDMVNKAK